MNSTKRLEELSSWQKGVKFLGSKYPIISGAMSYISESSLVSSISKAGGFGVLAGTMFTKEELIKEIENIRKITSNSFGVNILLLHPRLDELVQASIDSRVEYMVLAGGIPDIRLIEKIKNANIKIMTFAPSLVIAKKMISNYKVDALIIEGSEAGGHIGPCSTLVLAQEILPCIKEVPVFVAGGIGTGSALRSFLNMGASGIQVGTILVCTHECIAHPKFKESYIRAKARHAEASIQLDKNFPVIPVRAIANKATLEFVKVQNEAINKFYNGELSKQDAILQIENYWIGALKRAVIEGDVEYGSVMAGQSVGFVNKISSVEEVINNLITEAQQCLLS